MKDVPFPPGTSPFRCKGILYADTFEFADLYVRGGRAALFRRIEDAALRDFLDQPFVVGGWYDIFPLVALHGVAAIATGEPALEITRKVARAQVPRQFRGLYKFLLKISSPERMMRTLPRLANAYYDFVRVEVEEIRPRTFISTGCGVPAVIASAYMGSTEVGVLTALEIAGARGVRHRWLSPRPEGRVHGMDVVCVRREVSWD
jgi:hypothetical protein